MAHWTQADRTAGFDTPNPADIVARLRAALARYRAYTTTLRELEALTDRELDDIGVSRLSIREIAAESAYGTASR